MKTVLVLMSTYNGDKYLEQQIKSILDQEAVQIDLLVRDDGSTDRTVEILEMYKKQGILDFYKGDNLGPAQSFRDLVNCCSEDYDFYAYSDQDDVWDINKLKLAMKDFETVLDDEPGLWYCGLTPFISNQVKEQECCSIEKARSIKSVTATFATTNGCTMVINRKMILILKSCAQGKIDMHDSWTHAMCLACSGKVIYNQLPLIKYRIHSNQVLGGKKDNFHTITKRFFTPSKLRKRTVQVILTSKHISQEYKKYLLKLADYDSNLIHKLYLLIDRGYDGLTHAEIVKFKLQILTNRF